ncbi:MAG: hypothetical protein JO371_05990 [Paraburkholderia sp.]|nr:hypothetical protein [Paraburkholderia sp.]
MTVSNPSSGAGERVSKAGLDWLFRRTSDGTAGSGQMSSCFLAFAPATAQARITLVEALRAAGKRRGWLIGMDRSVTGPRQILQSASSPHAGLYRKIA